MELRQKDQRRCETVKPRRFKIDKLEERIAPSASCDVLSGLLGGGLSPEIPGRNGINRAMVVNGCF